MNNGMAFTWDKFIVPPPDAGAPAAAPGKKSDFPPIVVTVEVLLDVKDIARLDLVELWPLQCALERVDREISVASWPQAEPAAITEWRRGVARRAPRSGVAAAILHALEPYHRQLRQADSTLPLAEIRLPAGRVIGIRRNAVMMAWLDQVKRIVMSDRTEQAVWLDYWIAISGLAGTREHTVAWLSGVSRRAQAGSSVAARVIESIAQRDAAMAAIARAGDAGDPIVVRAPGIAGPSVQPIAACG